MTRLAVLSDIHGNLLALQAVLADVAAQGTPDGYWILGDLAVFCPWPAETLEALAALPEARFVMGNTDRYLVTGQRPLQIVHNADDWAALPSTLAKREANFGWTVERLSYDQYCFLRDLPPDLSLEVPGHGRILGVHGAPGNDETRIVPETTDDEIECALASTDACLVLYGHTHHPLDRMVGGRRLVNVGSVGLPLDGDPRAAWALLDFGGAHPSTVLRRSSGQGSGHRCQVTLRRVEYDVSAVLIELEQTQHPARNWVARRLQTAR